MKIKFAAIKPIDWTLRNGQIKIVTGNSFPRAMGMDFSGTVISVGAGVTRFKPGDAVFGLARFKECGALGQAVVTNETFLAKKPDNVSFEDAACLGTPGVTAWNGLADKAKLTAGQLVFVNGCTGAVGEATTKADCLHTDAWYGHRQFPGASERARLDAISDITRCRALDNSHEPSRVEPLRLSGGSGGAMSGVQGVAAQAQPRSQACPVPRSAG